jgi:hypothetical protein
MCVPLSACVKRPSYMQCPGAACPFQVEFFVSLLGDLCYMLQEMWQFLDCAV